MARRFADRSAAGSLLADALLKRGIAVDLVLAIPRGGLPLGRAVADAFDVPLDIVVAQKIGAPNNPEYAIGAVASDGSVWRNEDAFASFGVHDGYFERERERKATAARAKTDRYRGNRRAPDLTDKSVLVVDDGLATGATMQACLRMLGRSGAARIVVAVPVAPLRTVDEVAQLADEVVCLETPGRFMSVGQFYEQFGQVSDEEAMRYLDRSGAMTDP